MFPPASPEIFFQQWYKRYGISTLVKCKGDGENASTTEDFAKGLEKIGEDDRGFWQVKCLGPECIYQKSGECGRMAALQVILPKITGLGIWQINTGSYNSIVNINSALDWLRGLCGRFAMIPVKLLRVETDTQYIQGKETKRGKHFILQIDQQQFSIEDIQRFAVNRPIERALLPNVDESKDSLFFDKDGKRPALPAPEEIKKSDPAVEGPKTSSQAPKEPRTAPEEVRQQGLPDNEAFYGDQKRFPEKLQIPASKFLDQIKNCRKEFRALLGQDKGDERFAYVMGGASFATIAEINTFKQLQDFANTLLSELRNAKNEKE